MIVSSCIIIKTYSHLMQLVFVFTCIRLSNVINVVVRKRQLTLTLTSPSNLMHLIGLCCNLYSHRWFSGRMLACHAGGRGSIPGRCNVLVFKSPILMCLPSSSIEVYHRKPSIIPPWFYHLQLNKLVCV